MFGECRKWGLAKGGGEAWPLWLRSLASYLFKVGFGEVAAFRVSFAPFLGFGLHFPLGGRSFAVQELGEKKRFRHGHLGLAGRVKCADRGGCPDHRDCGRRDAGNIYSRSRRRRDDRGGETDPEVGKNVRCAAQRMSWKQMATSRQ